MENTLLTNLQKLRTTAGVKEYFAIILRRRWVIAVATLSVFIPVFIFVWSIEDVYESYSTVVIEQQNTLISQSLNYSGRSMDFYRGILNSRTFLESVIDSIGLTAFLQVNPKITHEEATTFVRNNFTLRNTAFASFLQLDARARSKELAYQIASVGTEIFRLRCQEVETEESRRAVIEIESQLLIIRKKLEMSEQEYQTFLDKAGQISEGVRPELKTLQDAYAANLAQTGIKEADLSAEKKQLATLEAKIAPVENERSPEYLKLRTRLSELEKEKMRLEALGIRLSDVSTVDREIADVEKQLLAYKKEPERLAQPDTRTLKQWQELRKSVINKEDELDLFRRHLESYRFAIENYKKNNPNVLAQSLELLRLKRSKDIYENLYNIMLQKAEEERIRSTSTGSGIKIVDLARIPEHPLPKNQTRLYLIALLLGLGMGIALAFFLEYLDTTIKSNEDLERYLEVPIQGTIPHIVQNKKDDLQIKRKSGSSKHVQVTTQYPRQLLNFKGDDSIITESYRSLRTNLTFVSPDNPLRTLLLTSAGPGEGKSLTIANLALAYAQMGKRTLLIDTDLRRPVQHHLFNLSREPGFSDLFIEEPDYAKIIRPTERENLSIITAGTFTPNPAELIASQKMNSLIEYFKQHFDMIFFDTPPSVAVTDAPLLSTKIDGVLLVVKSHHTDRDVAMRAVAVLRNVNAKIVGAVLNDINLSHRYSSYGYYKYYYHYYKSKTD